MNRKLQKITSIILVVIMFLSCVPLNGLTSTGLLNFTVKAAEEEKKLQISSASELVSFAKKVNAGNTYSGYTVILTADIDMSDVAWSPIGYNFNNYFAGVFDGKNHTISNLNSSISIDAANIINTPYHTIGLFGMCSSATISNIILDNPKFSITNSSGYQNDYSSIDGTCVYAGGVCGYADNTTISNVVLSDITISAYTGSEAGRAYAGGIVGYARNNCNISYCTVESGNVSGKSDSMVADCVAGGIVGEMLNEGSIARCANRAVVDGGHSISATYTGGICGKTSNSSSTLSMIRDCYNTGNVLHTGSWLETGYVGGIIGYSYSTVINCYSAGTVKANTNTVGGSVYVSGIAGSGSASSVVEGCAVVCDAISGGTNRYMIAGAGSKNNNASLSSITGSPTNDATSTYSKSTFTTSSFYTDVLGWDYDSVWQQTEGELPVLIPKSDENAADLAIVNEAISSIKIIYADGDTYLTVKNNIAFSDSPNEANVEWTSDNENVITNDGIVTRFAEDVQVKITAAVSSGDCSLRKIFVLNVLGTESSENLEVADWAMSIDDARSLVALMRNSKIKDISNDDIEVQVLTGINTDEEAISSFMANFMTYLEVPGENDFLKSKMGDIIGLIKSGTDAEFSALVSDFSDGLVNSEGVNGQTVAKKLIAIPQKFYNGTRIDYIGAYNAIKGAADFSNDPSASVYENTKNGLNKFGKVLGCITKTAEVNVNPSKIISNAFTGFEMFELYKAYRIELQNAAKSYIKQYLDLRESYDKKSIEFQAFMEAVAVTSIKSEIEDIDAFCESIYTVYDKFVYTTEDEYKVIIKCPVDVYVYDENGAMVGKVVNNEVDHSINNSLLITLGGENNDEKTIHIQDNEAYSIKLVGNDVGNMEVEVCKDNDNTSYIYADIPLETNKEMLLEISSDSFEQEEKDNIILLDEGVYTEEIEKVDSQNELHKLKIFVCEEDVFGNITLNTFGNSPVDTLVSAGEDISSYLTLNSGCTFVAYYTDVECTEVFDKLIMPESDLTLYAKCIRTDDRIKITQQPQDVAQLIGSETVVLSFDVSASVDYCIQWYKQELNSEVTEIAGAVNKSLRISTESAVDANYFAVIYVDGEDTAVRTNSAKVVIREKQVTTSGNCGETIVWEIIENDELVITGTGKMPAYSSRSAPWFDYASNITSVALSDGITSISEYAFEGFSSLKTLVVPDTVTSIGEYALSGCTSLTELSLPFVGSSRSASETYDAVLGYIFGRLTSSQTGGTIQYYQLKNDQFNGYSYAIPQALKKVIITDAEIIPFGAFHNCNNITEVKLNEGIANIGGYAFSEADSLTTMVIPKSVTTIAESVFNGCDSIVSLTLPFVGSSRTASGTYDAVLGYIFGRTESGTIQYHRSENGSLYYYNYAIPSSLVEVVLTDDEIIPMGAFHNCTNLTNIVLNEGITTIGEYAFANASAITKLTIPNSVQTIGEKALLDCTSLETLTMPFVGSSRDATGTYDAVFGYIFGRANEGTVQYYSLVNGSLSGYRYAIVDSLKNVVITDDPTIALGAFSNCTTLSTVDFKEATEGIENCAFYGVSALDKLIIRNKECSIYNSSNCIGITGTMYGYTASTAETFANSYSITFVPLDDETHTHTGGTANCKEQAKCTECGEIYGELDADNHKNIVTDAAVAATCSSTGLTEGSHCDACGEVIVAQTVTDKIAHTEEIIPAVDATCSQAGLTEGTKCSACGEILVEQEETEKLAHTGGTANCKEQAKCSVCEEAYGELDSNNHKNVVTDKAVAATCSKAGLTEGSHCDACGEVIVAQTATDKIAHTEETIPAVDATCSQAGLTEGTKCSVCGEVLITQTETEKLAHSYKSSVTASTCTSSGYTTFTCSVCGNSYKSNETPKLGHDMNEFVVTKQPSCSEKGTKVSECSRCDYSETQSINTTEHNYKDGVCEKCGYSKVQNCDHLCHKSGFMGFIWKIVRFFWKLFKMNPICECGVAHY